jgi:hypothetical protein
MACAAITPSCRHMVRAAAHHHHLRLTWATMPPALPLLR